MLCHAALQQQLPESMTTRLVWRQVTTGSVVSSELWLLQMYHKQSYVALDQGIQHVTLYLSALCLPQPQPGFLAHPPGSPGLLLGSCTPQ